VLAFLQRAGLAAPGEAITASALTGGVSSDIWKVDLRVMTWICYGLVRFLTGWSSYGRDREFR
jgi:hypothetical protein